MEYLIGGDLLALLVKRAVLTEEETRFYAAEMICCIEEAHALGYIHRDVKPGMQLAYPYTYCGLICFY